MRRLVLAPWVVLACAGSDDAADEAAATNTSSVSTGESDTTSVASTGADDGSSSGAPPGDGILECTETCVVPLDCCLPGTAGCPGAYPHNVDCVDGVCVPAQCMDDAECTIEGELCRTVRGVATCVTSCEGDPDVCTQPNRGAACVGTTDDGLAICFERCDAPGVFCGNETCDADTGLCVCTSSSQCQFNADCID